MDDRTLTKISLFISALWLVSIFLRFIIISNVELEPGQREIFITVLNILLIGFILIFGGLLVMRFGRFSAAKTLKSTHCQQCYAKMSKGQEFCPKCGWSRDPNFNKGKP
jgi:glucan phosphoethanolaminetransferase (alkaline phosphatase superfamily)